MDRRWLARFAGSAPDPVAVYRLSGSAAMVPAQLLGLAFFAVGVLSRNYVDDVITTQDDLLMGAAGGGLARLAKGSNRSRLAVDPVGGHLAWKPSSVVDVDDYLVDGAPNHLSAIQNAATAAGVNGLVRFGIRTYLVPVSGVSALAPLDGQSWVGGGRGTILQTEATFTASGILIAVPAGARFWIRAMRLVGPTASSAGFYGHSILHGGTSGEVHAERVVVTNMTNFLVCNVNSPVWFDIRHCDISVTGTAGYGGSSVNHSGDVTGAWVTSFVNVYRQFGLAGSNLFHAIETRKGCAVASVGDRFLTAAGTGFCITQNQGAGEPDFSTATDFYVAAAVACSGFLFSGANARVADGDFLADTAGPYCVRYQGPAGGLCTIDNVTFKGLASYVLADANDVKFRIANSTFLKIAGGFSIGGKTGTQWELGRGNRFPNLAIATNTGISGVAATVLGAWTGPITKDSGSLNTGGTMYVGCEAGDHFSVNCTGATINISTPVNGGRGQHIVIDIKNASGGALAVAWGGGYSLSSTWVNPPNGSRWLVEFVFDGTTWWEVARSSVNPMTTLGDLAYGAATGIPTRLAGAVGFLKGAVAGAPVWAQATDVAAVGATTNLDAVPGAFADLAAVQAFLAGAGAWPLVESRLDVIEAKADAIRTSLRNAGLMA